MNKKVHDGFYAEQGGMLGAKEVEMSICCHERVLAFSAAYSRASRFFH